MPFWSSIFFWILPLGFHLCLEKLRLTDIYGKLLDELKSEDYWYREENPGIRFDMTFDNSRKKSKQQGLVAGTTGSLKWESRNGKKTLVNFLIGLIHCKKTHRELEFDCDKVVNLQQKIMFCSRIFASTLRLGDQQQILSISRPSRFLMRSW